MIPEVICVDFETAGIDSRPHYPPRPIGVTIQTPGAKREDYLWGSPDGNNCEEGTARQRLGDLWDSGHSFLFHNGAFDVEVATEHWGFEWPSWDRIHDTMFLLFLHNPHAYTFSLKPAAEGLLGLAPEERDELEMWIRANIANNKEWGYHIDKAPGRLVLPYMGGDVDRTAGLFEHLYPTIEDRGMLEAYDRERRLMPIVTEGSRRGIRVDVGGLEECEARLDSAMQECDRRVWATVGSEFNVDSGRDLAHAIVAAGLGHENWPTTKTGKLSTAKDTIANFVADQDLAHLLLYRASVKTCLTTFVRGWLRQAQVNGRCHPSWNQVKGDKFGTKTGRLSSSDPNFQNVPNPFLDEDDDGKPIPFQPPDGLPEIPELRVYLLPEEGHVWGKRDYSQQEIRVLAHFEDGELMRRYQEDPTMDVHNFAQDLIRERAKRELPRKYVKITAFTTIYGGGGPAIARRAGCSVGEAYQIRDNYLGSMPDVNRLKNNVKERGKQGLAVRTWGAREIFAEPPGYGKDGEWRRFDYKLLNHLIQGSSADITKEAIIRWDEERSSDALFLATVHDEINSSFPIDTWKEDMECLKEAMNSIELDVPLLSDGFVGENWGAVEDVE